MYAERTYDKLLNPEDARKDDPEMLEAKMAGWAGLAYEDMKWAIDNVSDALQADARYLDRGEQRWVFELIPKSGAEPENLLKWNRHNHYEKNEYRWKPEPKYVGEGYESQTSGFWEDHVTRGFREKYPFMLQFIVPAEPVPTWIGLQPDLLANDILSAGVIQPKVEVMPTGTSDGLPLKPDRSNFDFARNNEYFSYQFIPKVKYEINLQLKNGVITKKEADGLEEWLEEIDGGNANFSADGRVLDYYDTTDLFEDGYDA